jgi:predicted ferric reductase
MAIAEAGSTRSCSAADIHREHAVTAIDISSYFGLGAITLLTLNILVGLLLSTKYNPVRNWPHRHLNTVQIHNWTGYAALALSLVHPVVILFSSTARFRLVDIVYPLNAPKQPFVNTLGALALYLLVVTVFTSRFRFQIGRRLWKPLHFANYGLFALYAVHAVLTDPNLKDAPIDPLDGEKVFVELCILVVLIGIGLRIRWHRQQGPPRRHRSRQRVRGLSG